MPRIIPRTLTILLSSTLLALGSLPAAAFHESSNDVVTVYQPGGLDPDVTAATVGAAARTGASWMVVHAGTIKLRAVTRGDVVIQETGPGFSIPMSAVAFDSERAEPVVGRQIATRRRTAPV